MPTTNITTSKSKNGYNICHASHKRKRCFANLFLQPSMAMRFNIGTSLA
jgi:ribosomal protein L28